MSTTLTEDLTGGQEERKNLLFDNPSIDINALPAAEATDFKRLDSNFMWVMFIRSNAFYLVFTLPTLIILFIKNDYGLQIWIYIVLGWFLLWILSNAIIPFKFRNKGYTVRQHDIMYRTGLWWKKKVIVPFNRIQHCEVKQGPFSKIFGLRSLTVYTAGGGSSDLKVSGLPEEKAEQLKEFVLRRITSEDDGE